MTDSLDLAPEGAAPPRDGRPVGSCSASRRTSCGALFPLYWPLLEPAGAVEILAHRIVWSLVTMVVLVLAVASHAAAAGDLRRPTGARWRCSRWPRS